MFFCSFDAPESHSRHSVSFVSAVPIALSQMRYVYYTHVPFRFINSSLKLAYITYSKRCTVCNKVLTLPHFLATSATSATSTFFWISEFHDIFLYLDKSPNPNSVQPPLNLLLSPPNCSVYLIPPRIVCCLFSSVVEVGGLVDFSLDNRELKAHDEHESRTTKTRHQRNNNKQT